MLMVIAGAGASYDSIPSRPPGESEREATRLPLADALFEPRPLFEEILWQTPHLMPIVPFLQARPAKVSVEEVLAGFAAELESYPQRRVQLAAARFNLQALIAKCEEGWYQRGPVPTNMMALIDQIESARRGRTHPCFATFNYDRLIEVTLENRGQPFRALGDYVRTDRPNVFKLHGSIDWVRPIASTDASRFGGSAWDISRQITEAMATLPQPGAIERADGIPGSRVRNEIAIPAIAIPLKEKSDFECPPRHLDALRRVLPRVRVILTIGWRGAEQHFLNELSEHCLQGIDGICVGGGEADARETASNLDGALSRAHLEFYGGGFTEFVLTGGVHRLVNLAWRHE
jgi:hypothetical protein